MGIAGRQRRPAFDGLAVDGHPGLGWSVEHRLPGAATHGGSALIGLGSFNAIRTQDQWFGLDPVGNPIEYEVSR